MNICFSLDALSPSGAKAWRLQINQHWRSCTYAEPLQTGDACLTDQQTIQQWLGHRLKTDKELGLIRSKKAGRFDFLMRGIFAHAVLHRRSSAPLPEFEQMVDCVQHCTPGTPWLIYLDPAGHFRALDTENHSILNNLDIAVRGEIASSAGYIGPQAAADTQQMQEQYRQFLAGWLEHLTSSNMQIFVPDPEKLKETETYLKEIKAWQPEQPVTGGA